MKLLRPVDISRDVILRFSILTFEGCPEFLKNLFFSQTFAYGGKAPSLAAALFLPPSSLLMQMITSTAVHKL